MDALPSASRSPSTTLSTPNLNQDLSPIQPLSDASSRMNTMGRSPQSRRASATARRIVSNQEHLSPTIVTSQDSDVSDGPDASWSGAVGKASLGKSGRVIERLMAEIDKHKRELNAEKQLREELEKREVLNTRIVDGLRTENANLKQAKETDAGVLKRRDRKIEELRADIDVERMKRVHAEESARQAARDRDEYVSRTNRELSEAKEIAKHASGHADVLEESHRQLHTEYQQRTDKTSGDFRRLLDEHDHEKEVRKKTDVVNAKLNREISRMCKVNSDLVDAHELYREEMGIQMKNLIEEGKRKETEIDRVRQESERINGEARYLLNLSRNALEQRERI